MWVSSFVAGYGILLVALCYLNRGFLFVCLVWCCVMCVGFFFGFCWVVFFFLFVFVFGCSVVCSSSCGRCGCYVFFCLGWVVEYVGEVVLVGCVVVEFVVL